MIVRLFLLFSTVTFVELMILLKLAELTSFWTTLGIIVVTGFVGAWLARREGSAVWRNIQTQLAQGQVPGAALVDGLCILVAGAFLMTPGLLTDLTGFLLLMPPVRALFRAGLLKWFQQRITLGPSARFVQFRAGAPMSDDGFRSAGESMNTPTFVSPLSGRPMQDIGVQQARPLDPPN